MTAEGFDHQAAAEHHEDEAACHLRDAEDFATLAAQLFGPWGTDERHRIAADVVKECAEDNYALAAFHEARAAEHREVMSQNQPTPTGTYEECPMHGRGAPGCEVCELLAVGIQPAPRMVADEYGRHMSASHFEDGEAFLALAEYVRGQDGPHIRGGAARRALDDAAEVLHSFALTQFEMAADELGHQGAES